MSDTTIPAKPTQIDWKHIALGSVVLLAPIEVHFLASVDWTSLGPTWSGVIVGGLQILNEILSNKK